VSSVLIGNLLFCFAGAAVASVLLQPAVHRGVVSVSLGASGAIFGLFAVSVLTRLSWDPRKLLEGAILGQFVVGQVLNEAHMQAVGGMKVGGLAVSRECRLGSLRYQCRLGLASRLGPQTAARRPILGQVLGQVLTEACMQATIALD
jgi:hypothetical protein